MNKIEEAQKILRDLGLSHASQQISALTLLALCDIRADVNWKDARQNSITLSNGIMEFAKKYYDIVYKPNTRESFRKLALKPFIDSGIAVLNPEEPNLSPTSSKTHYAISDIALKTIQKYDTIDWEIVAQNFKESNEKLIEQNKTSIILDNITISNFKSINNVNIDLGRINVFIGANGAGKSNILESLAFVGASRNNDISFDGLYSRGVRMARPNLIASSFVGAEYKKNVDITLNISVNGVSQPYSTSLIPIDENDIYSKWYDIEREEEYPETMLVYMQEILEKNPALSGNSLIEELNLALKSRGIQKRKSFDEWLSNYAIYDLNTKSLRGITPPDSRKTPLGLNGEGLDLMIASFNKETKSELTNDKYFDWLENVFSESNEEGKYSDLKAGKSISNLYFTDRYMNESNKTLSAENSNEGILHVLFYLSLFLSEKTPQLFGIDNIESALNPRLCRTLIKQFVSLANANDKQVLITTHNPSVLDGLNLLDDDQRLFEVYRNDEGHTQVNRIKFKSDLSDKQGKLSQMWLNGILGAVPKNF